MSAYTDNREAAAVTFSRQKVPAVQYVTVHNSMYYGFIEGAIWDRNIADAELAAKDSQATTDKNALNVQISAQAAQITKLNAAITLSKAKLNLLAPLGAAAAILEIDNLLK